MDLGAAGQLVGIGVIAGEIVVAPLLGVAFARAPLSRRPYWARHLATILIVIASFAALALAFDSDIALLCLPVLLMIASGLMAHWRGRRLIDLGRSRWWALADVLLWPIVTVLAGLAPSKASAGAPREVVETFR